MPNTTMSNNRQVLLLVLFCLVYIAWGLTDSIQAPFYPIEAEAKGATVGEYGFVFGIIHLAIFFAGPIFGRYMRILGLKNVYIFGVISTGVCALLFGFLDFVDNKAIFLGYSYGLRILEGIAEAASWSAVFAMLLQMFPQNVATVYSFTEASFSFSEMIGPTLGALLYSIGGFILPFEICGVLCLITGLLTIFVIPSKNESENGGDESEDSESMLHPDSILSHSNHSSSKTNEILPVLKNNHVLFALSGTVYAAAVQGLLEACLEHHLEQFNLSITRVGLTFLALSVPYFMASPLWGYFCDHLMAPEYVQAIGTAIMCFGFVLVGPAPYLPIAPSYPVVVIGLAFLGIGTAAGLVSSFAGAQKAFIEEKGAPPGGNESYAAISGIWTSSFALGNFIGPSIGGILFDMINFRNTSLVYQVVGLALLVLDIYRVIQVRRSKVVYKKVNSHKMDLYERI